MAGNALLEPDIVGKVRDMADMVYVADVKSTPGIASIKKGPGIKNFLFDWEVKNYGDRKRESPPDGKDVNAFDLQSPKVILQGRAEEFRRAPMVGEQAQAVSEVGGVYNTTSLFNEAKADQLLELGRDVEKALWANVDSRASDGVNGNRFRGLGLWLQSAPTLTDTLTIPAAARMPANQEYTGSIAALTEDQLGALIQAKYENTGASSDLRGFVTPVVKNKVGFFSRYQANVTGFTSNVFVTTGKLDGRTLFGPTVDIYKSDWGTFELFPVLQDFMPNAYQGFFLDMAHPAIRSLGPMKKWNELPDGGGGPRGFYKWTLTVTPGDLRAHARINGSA